MSRDLIDTLKDLTPNGDGLDRDALLFEAGRASAPSAARAWMLVGVLALTQTLTLALWLVPPTPSTRPEPSGTRPITTTPSDAGPSVFRASPDGPPPVPAADLLPDEPPLRPIDRTVFTSLE